MEAYFAALDRIDENAFQAARKQPGLGSNSALEPFQRVSDIMTRHGWAAQSIDLQGGPVRIGLLSDLPGISTYLFRALSAAFVIAVIFWTVTAVRRRRPGFSRARAS